MRRYLITAGLLALPLAQLVMPGAPWPGDALWWIHLAPVAVLTYRHGPAGAATGMAASLALAAFGADGGWLAGAGDAPELLGPLAVAELVVAGLAWQAGRELRSLEASTLRDPLTGLPSRRLFMERLTHRVERAARNPRPVFAVLMVGVREFGMLRDILGGDATDRMVRQLAERAQECVRTPDTVARWGLDTFAVLLDEVRETGDVVTVARRLQESLEMPIRADGNSFTLRTDIGIAPGSDTPDPQATVTHAASALQWARDSAQESIGLFDPERQAEIHDQLELEADLRQALEREEFLLEYQPIVSVSDETLAGFEALVRWRHPEHGTLPPARFIPTAEKTGFIVDLGEFVCREACTTLGDWQRRNPDARDIFLCVNLSARQLQRQDFAQRLSQICREAGVDPGQLKLEITESAVIGGDDATSQSIDSLRSEGFQLALDDFGTGYSSLSYLHRVPLRYLKIDRSFIQGVGTECKHLKILRSVVGMAGDLGCKTVAEGVETEQQEGHIRELGCDYMQGFHFAPPLSPSAAEARLAGQITVA